ncbi:MAG TPA: hypothetical protein PLP17_11015, partial [Oligoflexia bacterium]|nr:hypothetical protein [Oligoflexia bacterium]
LVILDTHLPDVSARELTLRLRTHSALKELPIIIMSPMVKLRDIDELLRLGASYFVPRPVKWPLLRDLVQRIIARRACRAQCLES